MYPAIRKHMTKSNYCGTVKALDNQPIMQSDNAVFPFNDENVVNPAEEGRVPAGQIGFDRRKPRKGLFKPIKLRKSRQSTVEHSNICHPKQSMINC